MEQSFRQTLLQTRAFLFGAVRGQQVGTQDEEQRKYEYQKRYQHCELHLLKEDAWQLQTAGLQPFGKAWTNSSWTETTEHLTILVDSGALVLEDFLHRSEERRVGKECRS